jgi:hypothetical protein
MVWVKALSMSMPSLFGQDEGPPHRFGELVFQLRARVAVDGPGAVVGEQEAADVTDVVGEAKLQLVQRPGSFR